MKVKDTVSLLKLRMEEQAENLGILKGHNDRWKKDEQ